MLIGWCPQTNIDTLRELIRKHKIKSVIEVGCFVGLSTVFFAEQGCKVWAIDTFDAAKRERYLNPQYKKVAEFQYRVFRKNTQAFRNVIPLVMTSEEAAYLNIEADLVYIDASHNYEDVKKDIALWLPKAKKILCGDDYTERWPGVRQAVDECGLEINKNQRVWFHEKEK